MSLKNNTKVFLALIACLFWFTTGVSSGFAGSNHEIIAFGDSITEGLWEVPEHEPGDRVGGYEPDLEVLTDGINNHYDVLNFGKGGERTVATKRHPYPEGGLHRLESRVLPHSPNAEFCLIMEGTNDYWDSVSRSTTVYTLGLMIDKVREYGITPILATMTPDTRPYSNKNVPAYNTLIRDLAIEKDVVLADFYPEMIDEWDSKYSCDSDTIHPSREGYEKMAEIWFEALSLPTRSLVAPWRILLLK